MRTSKNKKRQVIIVGANGFIGKHLTKFLLSRNIKVFAVDCHGTPLKVDKNQKDKYKFSRGFQNLKIDKNAEVAVFHLAGQSHAGYCQKNPQAAFNDNVALTAEVLEFCREKWIKKFIFPSTGLVYGTKKKFLITEKEPVDPPNMYSVTKVVAEQLICGYAKNYKLKTIIARLGNIYGKNGHPDTVTQIIFRQLKNNPGQITFKKGSPMRDFIYIDDVIRAFYYMIIRPFKDDFKIFNISTGQRNSIFDFAKIACKISGISPKKINTTIKSKQIDSVILDNKAFKRATNWKSKVSLSHGISKIIQGK